MDNTPWLLWLAFALAAGVTEIVTVDFVFLMAVGGCLGAALVAGLGLGFPLQVVVFALITVLLLVTARPPLQRWARRGPGIVMNVAALVGRPARVLEPVTENGGLIKLAGEEWTARPQLHTESFEVGSTVHVVRIDGATAVVTTDPVELGPHPLEGKP